MKKVIIPVVVLTVVAFAVYQLAYRNQQAEHHKEIPMQVSTNDSLTGNIGGALKAYYEMKDAFTKSDTSLVNMEAMAFVSKIDSVEMDDIKGDPDILNLAVQLKQGIATETNHLMASNDIEAKRKSFQSVSDGLFDLLRTIRYDGSKVYQLFCPMAFNNTGASWLSNSSEIVNPYFREKMLHCGDVRDSVNSAK